MCRLSRTAVASSCMGGACVHQTSTGAEIAAFLCCAATFWRTEPGCIAQGLVSECSTSS